MKRLFFYQYVRNVRTVGAVAPSSRFLAKAMMKSIDFEQAKVIIEYGPGTGVFTSEIAKNILPETKVIIIEQNKAFHELLKKTYVDHKNIIILHDSAENVESILKKHDIKKVDYIVSGLPFAALPVEVSDRILTSTKKLVHSHGVFITFQYTLLKKNFMHGFFKKIIITREYRNVPPAYVFTCTN
ncbi:MAG: rRNA adenine N-6-methyltransferase family protein [Candidatus Saccharimonadales bacterium]